MRTNAPTFYSFAVVNNDESVFIYIYMSSIHEESAGLRPYYSSNSIEEKVEREKRKRAMHVRHTSIIEISRSIEHERHDGCLCKSTWTSNCRGVKKNGCRNVTYSTSIYIYIYDDHDESFLRFSNGAKILGGDNV